jgi:hypothetical protein
MELVEVNRALFHAPVAGDHRFIVRGEDVSPVKDGFLAV